MSKEKFVHARDLIQARRYDEARAVLKTIQQPAAGEWLAKLDKLAAQSGKSRSSRWILAWICALMMVLTGSILAGFAGSSPVKAQSPVDVAAAAHYFPADTATFAAMRIDESYVDELESLWQLISSQFHEFNIEPMTLRDVLSEATGQDVDAILPWLGDVAAMGLNIDSVSNPALSVYSAVEIDDAAEAEAFLTPYITADTNGKVEITKTDDATVYRLNEHTTIELRADVLYVTLQSDGDGTTPELTDTLYDNPAFQRSIGELPAEGYNLLVYNDVSIMHDDPSIFPSLIPLETLTNTTLVSTALGATILNGDTLTLDVAFVQAEDATVGEITPIDETFARFIPGDASLVLHGSNLSGLIDSGLTSLDKLNAGVAADTSSESQLNKTLGFVGLDLRKDILAWADGDYATFVRADVSETLKTALLSPRNPVDINGRFDFGAVIKTSNPEASRALQAKLEPIIFQFVGQQPGVKIVKNTIGSVPVLEISVSQPQPTGKPLDVTLVMGVSDDIFFIMTADAARKVLEQGATLDKNAAYIGSKTVWLNHPTSVWYSDAQGALSFSAFPALVLLGPSIGNVFSNIVAGLNGEPTPTPSPTPIPSPTPNVGAVVDYAVSKFRYATMTTSITPEGTHLLRMTISVNK